VKPFPRINKPKCADCSSTLCFPWRREEFPDAEVFVWRYLRDHPDALRTRRIRKPRKPQSETLF
jgi:hypothetical protein